MERRRHYIYPDMDTLAGAFVCEVRNFLLKALKSERTFHIALSGGSTPLSIFKQLVETTGREEWSNIHLYWVDERCVPPDNDQSNFLHAKNRLIDPLGIPEDLVHRIHGEGEPSMESTRYGQLLLDQLPIVNGVPVFDWIWLGLGADGHTASIFPHELNLWNAEEPCVVATHPETGQKRISITGNLINAASRVSFVVAGEGKASIVNEIMMKEGKFMEYPAFYVAPGSKNLEWFLDQDSASLL